MLPTLRTVELAAQRTELALAPVPAGLPVHALSLEVEDDAFVRGLRVEDSTGGHAWRVLGAGHVFRVPGAGGARSLARELLRVHLRAVPRAKLRLRLDHGDDPPLRVSAVRALYPLQEVVVRSRAAGPFVLLIGRAGDPGPRYDLPELLRRAGPAAAVELQAGPLEPNPGRPATGAPPAPEAPPPFTDRYPTLIRAGLIAAALGLLIWTVLLVRRMRRR